MAQEWSLTQGAQPVKRKGKGAIITGIVLMVVALIAGIAGIVGAATTGVNAVASFASPVTSPDGSLNQLDGGKSYVVYQLLDVTAEPVTAADVTVTAPDGSQLSLSDETNATDSYTSGSETFVSVAGFTAPTTGEYTTEVTVAGTIFVVGPGLSALGAIAMWGLLIGAATLLGIIGLVVLIVGIVRRASSKPKPVAYGYPAGAVAPPSQPYVAPGETPRPQLFEQPGGEQAAAQPFVTPAPAPEPAQSSMPPAGWYPDPGRPGGQRYWDGQQWTEHQA